MTDYSKFAGHDGTHSGATDSKWGNYQYLTDIANAAIKKFPGMRITSGQRDGDRYHHGQRQAIDIAFPPSDNGKAKYKEVADWVFETFSTQVAYVITLGQVRDRNGYSGTGKSGKWVRWPDGDHYDHLHISGNLGVNNIKKGGIAVSLPKSVILDISEWQVPSKIDYDKMAKEIAGVIIRVQYGSNYVDKHYKTHINEFKKRGIPIAVYAWVRGTSLRDMETEATDFYNRAKEFNPTFWWLDVEEYSMKDMRGGCEKYRAKLKALGAKKVGAYVANHMYHGLNLDTAKFDGIWIPTYGSNNGQYNGSNPTSTFAYDIHQYTSNGKLSGYDGPLDLNRLANIGKGIEYYFGSKTATKPESGSTTPPKTEQGGINVKTITTTADKVKLRSAAKVANNVIAELPKGSTVKINDIVIAGGIIWGVQPRANNQKGYIDLGKQFGWIK